MDKKIEVVVLDDEQSILSSVRRIFMNEEFGIAVTTSHEEALQIIEKEDVKVALSDQRMPNVTGVEYLGMVKEKFPKVVRMIFTGHADLEAAEQAINECEVYRFINKPWNVEELKDAVRHAINHFNLVEENKSMFESLAAQNEDLELMNRKLKAMYEKMKEFTSTVSHELRTPLTSIKSSVDLVLSESTGTLNDDQKKFLSKAVTNVDRLARLINDILDLSKLESGKAELKFEFNSMQQLIEEVIGTQEQVAKEKGLFLKMEAEPDVKNIPFDWDRMSQVLNNLVSNAIKFTEQGGITVRLTMHQEGNNINVCVKDTGEGILEEDLPKLFQKFQQLGDPSTRKTGGTGLGLAICLEIIKQHGGKIWAESQPGEGSTFCILLPITERRKEMER